MVSGFHVHQFYGLVMLPTAITLVVGFVFIVTALVGSENHRLRAIARETVLSALAGFLLAALWLSWNEQNGLEELHFLRW